MALWTPADITTALWLDAADSSTLFDATSGGSTPADDGQIARWEDKSGNARHCTQATSDNRPLRLVAELNGKDAASFNGTNSTLSGAVRVVVGDAKSVFYIAKSNNAVGNEIFQNSSGGGRSHLFRAKRTGGTSFIGGDSTVTNTTIAYDFSTDIQSAFLASHVVNASMATSYWLNGTSRSVTGTILTESINQGYQIGSAVTLFRFGWWPGLICEMVVLASEASTIDRQLIEGYLAHKWGLAGSLPSDHPYKSSAPTRSIYAVNGKTPVAAWIPSLDTAGNGTTTLTDLMGSNNGTLTNMDAATDWVADTGAGGVRALDFDGVNDYISMGSPASLRLNGPVSIAAWVYPRSLNRLAIAAHTTGSATYFILMFSLGSNQRLSFWNLGSGPAVTAGSISDLDQWHHFAAVRSASGVELFLNGVTAGTAGLSVTNGTAAAEMVIGRSGSFNSYMSSSRIDDVRIWNQALDADDVSALYAAGLGRGITFGGTTMQTRRRRDLGGFGL